MILSNHLILSRPISFCLQSFPASGSFPLSQLFASDGQSIRASASASVLPMNIQGWLPLGLTGLISLLSRELSTVFSSTTLWKHQLFALSLLYDPTLTSICNFWENHSFDYTDLCQQVLSLLFNTRSRFVIVFLPRKERSKHLFFSFLVIYFVHSISIYIYIYLYIYICTHTHTHTQASLVAWMVKNLPAMWEIDLGSIHGLGRSPGGEHGNPL